MNEQWQTLDFAPAYAVSNYGRVKRISDCLKTGRKAGQHLTPDMVNKRLLYTFSIEGKRVRWQAHRLVMAVFGPPKPTGRVIVAHNDGDPTNNYIGNLRWATYKENTADRVAHGTDMRGSQCKQALLSEDDVRDILAAPRYRGSCQQLADKYGVSRAAISKIVNRKNWLHVHTAQADSVMRERARL